jgi:hypothetical protein
MVNIIIILTIKKRKIIFELNINLELTLLREFLLSKKVIMWQ